MPRSPERRGASFRPIVYLLLGSLLTAGYSSSLQVKKLSHLAKSPKHELKHPGLAEDTVTPTTTETTVPINVSSAIPPTTSTSTTAPKPSLEVVEVSSTSYCQSGTMSDGKYTSEAAVAMNTEPLGTEVQIMSGTLTGEVRTVEDHIGSGSQFDIFLSDCTAAIDYGRQEIEIKILHTP